MPTQSVILGSLTLELPILPIPNTNLNILAFDSFGNTQLIQAIAKEAIERFTRPDFIVCPEAKAIPLTQEMARLWNIDYFVLRKQRKLYMQDPQCLALRSITTMEEQQLWYDRGAMGFMKGKKGMIFDDVVSTGGTLQGLIKFAEENDVQVSTISTLFLEGQSDVVDDIRTRYTFEYLGYLPLIEGEAMNEA